MATETMTLASEIESFATPRVASGRYANTADVVHAAMDALRLSEAGEEAINDALLALAEEGEASGDAEGDIFATILAKYGLNASSQS